MLVRDVNDGEEEIKKINRFVRDLKAHKIQLNTVLRPPADSAARAVDRQTLSEVKALFDPKLSVEIVADFERMTRKAYHKDLDNAIVELLKRRPARRDEMAAALGVHPNEIVKYLQALEDKKRIKRLKLQKDSEEYYHSAEK
ncbi:MAG: hypothetical protein GTO24_12950 [candidate division Zixibacteria bacterium]|nr:hypothetical protein [candidate division Zixibacteria bacterium]